MEASVWGMLYIYTPNLGLEITIFVLGREQGRFRGSREGARGSKGEQGGARGRSTRGAAQGSLNWLPRNRL